MAINYLRKIGRKFGLDVHKYRPAPNHLDWLKGMDIKTVIDVGANTGQFAKEIREVLPYAKIYSFEPLFDCFSALKRNMNNDRNFEAFNFALGVNNETVPMHRSAYTPSSSILPMADSHKTLFPHTQKTWVEKITVKKFDTLEKMHPSRLEKQILFKIDTQGFEDKVIKGAERILDHVKIMIVETSFIPMYEKQPLFKDIHDMLSNFGFEYRGALHQKLNPKNGCVLFEDSFYYKV